MDTITSLLTDLRDAFKAFTTQMKQTNSEMESVADLEARIRAESNKTAKAVLEQKKALKLLSDLEKELAATRAGMGHRSLKEVETDYKEVAISVETSRKYVDKFKESLKSQIGILEATKTHFGGLIKQWQSGITFLGGTALGFAAARDSLLKYNASIFAFSRIQQVAGRGMGDLKRALIDVAQNTTLSQKDFAAFAEMVSRQSIGLAPSAAGIANFAKNIQHAFGPDPQKTIEVGQQLMGIMGKYPALFKQINAIMDANRLGQMSKAIEGSRKTAMLTGVALGMSVEELKTMATAMAQTTAEQNKQVEANKSYYKMAQSTEDLMLSAAKSMEKAFKNVADAVSSLINAIESIAPAIAMLGIGKTFGEPIIKAAMSRLGSVGGLSGSIIRGPIGKMAGVGAILAGATVGVDTYQRARGQGVGQFKSVAAGGIHGGAVAGGAIGGMKIGAALGSFWGPVGTLAGGAIGAGVGGLFGNFLGGKVANSLIGAKKEAEKLSKTIESGITDNFMKALIASTEFEQNLKAVSQITAQISEASNSMMNIFSKLGTLSGEMSENLTEARLSAANIKVVSIRESILGQKGVFEELFKDVGKSLGEVIGGQDYDVLAATGSLEEMDALLSKIGKGLQASVKGVVDPEKVKALTELLKESANIGTQITQRETLFKEQADGDSTKAQQMAKNDPVLIKYKLRLSEIQQETEKLKGTEGKAMAQLDLIYKKRLAIAQVLEEQADATVYEAKTVAESSEKHMGALSQRLQAQRELYEAAMFGMGASIEMIQKQVNLEYSLSKVQSDRAKKQEQEIKKIVQLQGKSIGSGEIEALSSMASLEERMAWLRKHGITDENKINALIEDRNLALTQQMQHQKKIYELTKDMREGYLDAVREMTIGAGEFEKIIGTQEMGVTQLMDAVNQFTETGQQNMLNTMKLGGYQNASMTAAGVGTTYTGQYTVSGGRFESGPNAEAKAQRIWGYKKSQEDLEKMARGEVGAPQVGTGVAGELEDTSGAVRDGSFDGTREGAKEGIVEGLKGAMRGVNPTVMGHKDPGPRKTDVATGMATGTIMLNASTGGRANIVPTTTPNEPTSITTTAAVAQANINMASEIKKGSQNELVKMGQQNKEDEISIRAVLSRAENLKANEEDVFKQIMDSTNFDLLEKTITEKGLSLSEVKEVMTAKKGIEKRRESFSSTQIDQAASEVKKLTEEISKKQDDMFKSAVKIFGEGQASDVLKKIKLGVDTLLDNLFVSAIAGQQANKEREQQVMKLIQEQRQVQGLKTKRELIKTDTNIGLSNKERQKSLTEKRQKEVEGLRQWEGYLYQGMGGSLSSEDARAAMEGEASARQRVRDIDEELSTLRSEQRSMVRFSEEYALKQAQKQQGPDEGASGAGKATKQGKWLGKLFSKFAPTAVKEEKKPIKLPPNIQSHFGGAGDVIRLGESGADIRLGESGARPDKRLGGGKEGTITSQNAAMKKVTSESERRVGAASAATQAALADPNVKAAAEASGISFQNDTGKEAGGEVTVVIKLDAGLDGEIRQAGKVRVTLEQASGRRQAV